MDHKPDEAGENSNDHHASGIKESFVLGYIRFGSRRGFFNAPTFFPQTHVIALLLGFIFFSLRQFSRLPLPGSLRLESCLLTLRPPLTQQFVE